MDIHLSSRREGVSTNLKNRLFWIFSGFLLALVILLIMAGNLIRFPDCYASALFDRDKNLLSAVIASDGQWRFFPPDSLPSKYVKSVLIAEDRRFYAHHGVDLVAVARAVWLNTKHDEIISGASTITMQVVRMARRNQPRTFPEKLMEVILASGLELVSDKDQILRMYAAHAPFGGNVVGLEAAAWRYFGRQPAETFLG